MSGETERAPSGWTPDTLLAHLLALMDARNTHLDERFDTQNRNLTSALASINERLAAANEIRAAWQDDRANLPTRAEVDARLKPLETFVSIAQGRDTGVTETRTSARLTTGTLLSALMAVIGIATLAVAIIVATSR